jgi:hypothetical protein
MNAETNSLQMIVAANDNPGFVVISISTHCITELSPDLRGQREKPRQDWLRSEHL